MHDLLHEHMGFARSSPIIDEGALNDPPMLNVALAGRRLKRPDLESIQALTPP